ncbi:tRNA dihydrouridine(20/20a) synthase DusA [Amaricoccus macauensis]|uniref:tRNA dihydrouridine(20/20a) synthase DusA n=1 Tax=Amaricoccus macauensis TaxID=57001 RepID=UPI003C7B21F2
MRQDSQSNVKAVSRLSVAPMMDWTDRHCRVFHRLFTRRTLLYTEMVTTGAILHGPADRLLAHDASEHPVALQLGGSEPDELAAATRTGAAHGYDEINLNVGCPSDRVQSGCFGAALMRDPGRVAECVAAMKETAGDIPVTVKCRIGVDDQEPEHVLPDFIERIRATGICTFIIHARKAWLQGLSPAQNRDIPPLDYGLVGRMKTRFPDCTIVINGGIPDLKAAQAHLADGLDGVMIGRAAYHNPSLLGSADRLIFDAACADTTAEDAVRAMLPYIERELSQGTRLNQITRHMLGAFQGRPGARAWRRHLSENGHLPGAGPETVEAALSKVMPGQIQDEKVAARG